MPDYVRPTIAEILASTEMLSNSDASNKVVKIRDNLVVKYGGAVSLVEADTLQFIGANSTVPLPKVFDSFLDPETRRKYIVMELVEGVTLEKLSASLTATEKRVICDKLKAVLDELRSLNCWCCGLSVGARSLLPWKDFVERC